MMRKGERASEEDEKASANLPEDPSPPLPVDAELWINHKLNTLIDKRLAAGALEKVKPRRSKRMVSARFAVVLSILVFAGTAFALTQTTLPNEVLEIFNTNYVASDFSIASFTTKPQGGNKLTIDITLDNQDGVSAHQANVTVNLINATADEFLNLTLATGSVAASGSVSLSFVFNQANVVANYQDSQVVIDQSS
ncbi:MAG: hypothetical protein V3U33_03670 [candidate division NC10 bacterium]